MPITADQAAEIAQRHGLSLSDAQALSLLADDEGHAERLAEQFRADPQSESADVRTLAAAIPRDGGGGTRQTTHHSRRYLV